MPIKATRMEKNEKKKKKKKNNKRAKQMTSEMITREKE
jgi:hypothetical protein